MATEQERLKGIIEIDTVLRELDQLLVKLAEVESAIQAVDGSTVRVDVETRGFESAMAQMGALRGTGVGDVDVSGGGDGTVGGGRGRSLRSIARLGDAPIEALGDMTRQMAEFSTSVGSASDTVNDMTETTAGLFSNMDEFDLRMTDMHNALAKAVPLIIVIIGALPALIAGLVGLAAAAAAATAALLGIAGFGALGFAMAQEGNIMEGFSEILDEVRSDFLDAFTPLAQQLAPLFSDALDGLDMFFQALADNGDALLAFEQTARNFGAFLVDEFPDFIAFLADVARAFEPVFSAIADALFDSNVGQGFMQFMADVIGPLMRFGGLLAAMLPLILDWSIGFLRVTNAIMTVLNILFQIISVGGRFSELVGLITGGILAMATAILLSNTALIQQIARLGASTLAFIKNASAQSLYTTATNIATAATSALATAMTYLIGLLTFGVGVIAAVGVTTEIVSSKFDNLTGSVNTAADSIRNFDRTTSRMDGARVGAFSPSSTVARGQNRGQSVSQTIRVEGDADKQTLEQEQRNGHFRMKNLSTQ